MVSSAYLRLSTYKGGGNSCFDPRMMLKVLIYAYLNNIEKNGAYFYAEISEDLCQ